MLSSVKLIDDNVNISLLPPCQTSKINFVGGRKCIFLFIPKNADLKIAGNFSSDWMVIDEFLDGSKTSETPQESNLK